MQSTYTTTLRLQAVKRGIYVGAAVNARALHDDAAYREVLAREYNLLTPENEMKFGSLVSDPHVYNFGPAEEIVAFARANDMRVRGHTLIWHNQNPPWMVPENFTRNQALDLMYKHIFTVMGHFRGEILAWDVLNEAVDQNGSLRDTFWLRTIGPEYIEFAFRWAREADPNVKLFYNEYAADGLSAKANGMYELLKGLKERNIPLDGVGLQMHFAFYDTPNFVCPPTAEELTANLNRLADLGLEIHITEMDVQIQQLPGTREELLLKQAQTFAQVLHTSLQNPQVKAFITWGFTDRYSWIPHFTQHHDAALPFDEDYNPKLAYDAILEVIGS